jgi:hypothetical protein
MIQCSFDTIHVASTHILVGTNSDRYEEFISLIRRGVLRQMNENEVLMLMK